MTEPTTDSHGPDSHGPLDTNSECLRRERVAAVQHGAARLARKRSFQCDNCAVRADLETDLNAEHADCGGTWTLWPPRK